MDHFELILFGVLVSVAALSVIARRINVPYPILLVVFLPPLLYSAAFFSSLRDLRANLRPITLLATGLVLLTTVTVDRRRARRDRRAPVGGRLRPRGDRLPHRPRRRDVDHPPRRRAAAHRAVLESESLERRRALYEYRRRRFKARVGKVEDDGFEDRSLAYQRSVQSVIAAQRRALVGLRDGLRGPTADQ